jgi:CubicO group peptidase (beta-lactamase class C family)
MVAAGPYAEFERLRDAAIGEGRLAGVVAMTFDRSRATYESAAGRRSVSSSAPMTLDTVFWIASMTKAVTSVAALREVERGALSLDEDLSGLLPDLKDLEVFDREGPAGVWTTRPARRGVTLRQLLTHTSGFGYGFLDPRLAAWAEAGGRPDPASGLRAAHRQPLLFDPGEGWAYGIGIDWAGLAVEAASGLRLDAHFADRLLGPLGMIDTAFGVTPARQARAADRHARTPDGGLAAAAPYSPPPDPEVLAGGGGLTSTAADYGRFLRMLLNDGELDGVRVLSRDMVNVLGEIQTGELRAGAWRSPAPNVTADFDLFPGMRTGWGLATLVNPEPGPNGRSAGSLAWAGIANTYYWADRAAGKAGVLLTQVTPFGDPLVLALLGALERGAYAA